MRFHWHFPSKRSGENMQNHTGADNAHIKRSQYDESMAMVVLG